MSCQEVCELLDAYLDKELDVVTSSRFERHFIECASCRTQRDQYLQMHNAVQAHMEYFQAPEELERKLRTQLFPSPQSQSGTVPREWFPSWRTWVMAAGLVTVLLFTVLLLQLLRRPSASDMLAEQVVSSHIRSLLANHLSDVISTDQHTVKPWFSGKIDFAPVVKDLSSKGFPLAGGRLDYLDDRSVSALVYKRRQHTINLFAWPSGAPDSAPRSLTSRGYNVVHWTHSRITYWAVSDVSAGDLREFERDLEN